MNNLFAPMFLIVSFSDIIINKHKSHTKINHDKAFYMWKELSTASVLYGGTFGKASSFHWFYPG